MSIRRCTTVIMLVLVCQCVWGKDLYVSPTGNDSVSRTDNNIAAPWQTVQKAFYTAEAGDVVYYRAGSYTLSAPIDMVGNGNNGTSGSWIEHTPYLGESVTWASAGVGGSSDYNCIFSFGKNYHYIHGTSSNHLTITASTGDNRVFVLGYVGSCTGFRAEYLDISGWANGDNSCAFYVGQTYASVEATAVIIKHCTLVGLEAANNQNYCGIQTFGATNYQIENNEISQVVHGIYLKHSSVDYADTGKTVKYNWIHDQQTSSTGSHKGAIDVSDNYVAVSHNICHHGINIGEDAQAGGAVNGNYNTINHNTSPNYGITLINDGGSSYNNITNGIFSQRTVYGTGNTFDYNMYVSGAAIGEHDLANTSATYTGGASPSTISGFALTSESAGYMAGSDSKDMGADVSLVGVDTGSPSPSTTITGCVQSGGVTR